MCAADRLESPTTSTSSWIAVAHHHLRRLLEAAVDHLHAGVAQRARDHGDADGVAVEPELGEQHADAARLARGGGHQTPVVSESGV